jgi:riboflavin synthase
MFTGLVVEKGRVVAPPEAASDGGMRLWIGFSPAIGERLVVGSSLAVAGVCLTVVELLGDRCRVDLAPETLRRTTLGGLQPGGEVNLEPSLRLGDALGGHWLQGHVDGRLRVTAVRRLGDQGGGGEHWEVDFSLPEDYALYVVEKGSIALDGVSLTVAARLPGGFRVALIPHTLAVTTLGTLEVGAEVNFEVDVMAKQVVEAVRRLLPGIVGS